MSKLFESRNALPQCGTLDDLNLHGGRTETLVLQALSNIPAEERASLAQLMGAEASAENISKAAPAAVRALRRARRNS